MEIIIGALAAWGLLMLLWTLVGVLLLPLTRRKDISMTVLIRGKEDAPQLDRYLRGLLWLRDMGFLWWDVVILEDELDASALDRAKRLTENEQHVSMLRMDQLKDWME